MHATFCEIDVCLPTLLSLLLKLGHSSMTPHSQFVQHDVRRQSSRTYFPCGISLMLPFSSTLPPLRGRCRSRTTAWPAS